MSRSPRAKSPVGGEGHHMSVKKDSIRMERSKSPRPKSPFGGEGSHTSHKVDNVKVDTAKSPRLQKSPIGGARQLKSEKMDTVKAHNILGFSKSNWSDFLSGKDPKDVLDHALSEQMQRTMTRKSDGRKSSGKDEPERTTMDEVMSLHEAYQYLVQKYVNSKPKKTELEGIVTVTIRSKKEMQDSNKTETVEGKEETKQNHHRKSKKTENA